MYDVYVCREIKTELALLCKAEHGGDGSVV